jgi:hypothetical protein
VEALREYELKFWEEFFEEEGEENIYFWMKLVGLYIPETLRVIQALVSRKRGQMGPWLELTRDLPSEPPYCRKGDFFSNDLGGLMMWLG